MTYGLIGKTLSHSYSKLIHEMLGKYSYDLFPMEESQVEAFIGDRRFDGLNVTIPYKRTVMPLCDFVSEKARAIGAVNTLYFDDQGKLCGTNTDYDGFLFMARRAGVSFTGKKVLILGDGGASLAVRKAALDAGAAEILIASRKASGRAADGAQFVSYDNLALCCGADVIVNATPVGTYPGNGQYLIDLSAFPALSGVLDLIYNPFLTDLLFQARERGIACSGGLPMLVAQATKAAELFLGRCREGGKNPYDGVFQQENERILQRLEGDLTNLVLIGMPGTGKTTVGRKLAHRLGREFVDLDEAVVSKAEMSIPQVFERCGESAFRDMETAAARDYGKLRGQVIAAGGGIVLKKENMTALKQNGVILFIRRPLETLVTEGRPLSKDLDTLKSMYKARLPLYTKYSDLIIECNANVSDNADAIIERLGYQPAE